MCLVGPGMNAEVVSNHFYCHRKNQILNIISDNLPYIEKTGTLLSTAESFAAKFMKQNVFGSI
jgi:hypothetical protein